MKSMRKKQPCLEKLQQVRNDIKTTFDDFKMTSSSILKGAPALSNTHKPIPLFGQQAHYAPVKQEKVSFLSSIKKPIHQSSVLVSAAKPGFVLAREARVVTPPKNIAASGGYQSTATHTPKKHYIQPTSGMITHKATSGQSTLTATSSNTAPMKSMTLNDLLSGKKLGIFNSTFKPAPQFSTRKKISEIKLTASNQDKSKTLPVWSEDSLGVSRQMQLMLVKSNNDDDFETGEHQARRATDYCRREAEEGVEARREAMSISQLIASSDEDSDAEYGVESNQKRGYSYTPAFSCPESIDSKQGESQYSGQSESRQSSCDF